MVRHLFMKVSPFALAVLIASSAGASGLDDFRAALRRSESGPQVRARIEVVIQEQTKGEKKPDSGPTRASVVARTGPDGFALEWEMAKLAALRKVSQKSLRKHLEAITAMEALRLVDPAPHLLSALDGATLLEEKTDRHDGVPCRRLLIRPERKPDPEIDPLLKEFEASWQVWIDADGWPLAMKTEQRHRGRKLLISFKGSHEAEYRFGRAAGRLIVERLKEMTSSEAMGSEDEETSEFTVTLLD